jgi:molybdopterin synthase sulfur carrier subunit
MIVITVKGVAAIGKLIGDGGEREILLPPGSTLGDLLKSLGEKCGEAFRKRIFAENGELRKELRFLLNGRDIIFLAGLESELQDGDRFSILPPLAGG